MLTFAKYRDSRVGDLVLDYLIKIDIKLSNTDILVIICQKIITEQVQ